MATLKEITEFVDGIDAIPAETYVYNIVLAANVAKNVTIPEGVGYTILAADNDVWVNFQGTAVVPIADVSDGSGSVLNPEGRYVKGITTISVISEYSMKLSISFFRSPY